MKTFYIKYIGCERRGLDAERIKNYLIQNKLKRAGSPENADYLLVITCGVGESENASIKIISDFQKYKGELIIGGCLPSMNPKKIRKIYRGNKIFNTKNIDQIDNFFPNFEIKFKQIEDPNRTLIENKSLFKKISLINFATLWNKINLPKSIEANPKIPTIRISRGCTGNCSYCTIRQAIGRLKSKQWDEIFREIKKALLKKQYRINIISSDTGSYGLDIGSNFPQLLEKILDLDNRIKIEFIQDLHPRWICRYNSELVNLIKTKKIKKILTAVQSGSERMLKLMNRPTDLNKYQKTLKKMKEIYPRLELRTQIIVGFPTETEEDFQTTINFVKDCKFDTVDVFKYQEYKMASSAKIKPKVFQRIIEQRFCRAKEIFSIQPKTNINIDKLIGQFGLFLKRRCPKLYYKLKK